MTKIIPLNSIVLAMLAGVAFPIAAQPASTKDYEYCRQDYSSDLQECGFSTMEQCVAMISGRGGSCTRDPYLVAAHGSYTDARKGRGHRRGSERIHGGR